MISGCFLVWMIVSTSAGPVYRDPAVTIGNLINATLLLICIPLHKLHLLCQAKRNEKSEPISGTHLSLLKLNVFIFITSAYSRTSHDSGSSSSFLNVCFQMRCIHTMVAIQTSPLMEIMTHTGLAKSKMIHSDGL